MIEETGVVRRLYLMHYESKKFFWAEIAYDEQGKYNVLGAYGPLYYWECTRKRLRENTLSDHWRVDHINRHYDEYTLVDAYDETEV